MINTLEHFYVRRDWNAFYAGLYATHELFLNTDQNQPWSESNKSIFETINDRMRFLENLLSEQRLTVPFLNENLKKLINVTTSLISLFEDDEIRHMSSQRLIEICKACEESFRLSLAAASDKHHRMQPEIEDTEKEPEPIPILHKDSTFDNFRDAMRVILSQSLKDESTRERSQEVSMTPEQRMFYNIKTQQEKTLSNFGTAINLSLDHQTIQFATGLIALQGFFDRKDLTGISHTFVQLGNLRISRSASDTMTPTVFLYDQRFAVFPHFKTVEKKTDIDMQTRAIQKASDRMGRSCFGKPFRTPHFPHYEFLWFPETDLIRRLKIRTNTVAALEL